MLSKLKIDALKADLAAVENLLGTRSPLRDPVGFHQLATRKTVIQSELQSIESREENHANIGVFFGGIPVFGSRGIRADFATKAIDHFQDIVAKSLAKLELGQLAAKGPVPLKNNAHLMITDVARGSFGFILEEIAENSEALETPLSQVVEGVAELIQKITSETQSDFDETTESLDGRLLVSLKQFFQLMDDHGATLRLVGKHRTQELTQGLIRIARERIDSMEISEVIPDPIVGELFLLPSMRRFELHKIPGGEIIKGTVTTQCLKSLEDRSIGISNAVVGKPWTVQIQTRTVKEKNRPDRSSHTLIALVAPHESS